MTAKSASKFVFDTAMIQIFGWITQNLFQKSGI